MKWLNKYKLPDRVIRVIEGKHKHDKPTLKRLSVTDLIDEPLPRILFITQWEYITRDYSDLLVPTQGTALHSRYELCASDDEDAEHKFEDDVEGITVVGKADSYFDKTILDIKQTGVYGPEYKKDKWTKQCNCYAWERRKHGEEVDDIVIDVWYRDWKQNRTSWKGYPKIPYEEMHLKVWSFEEQEQYINSQVEKHLSHPVHDKPEEYTEPCSNKQRGIRWEIYKKGNKTPTKVCSTEQEALTWTYGKESIFSIRKSEPVFCNLYCKARSVCIFAKGKHE